LEADKFEICWKPTNLKKVLKGIIKTYLHKSEEGKLFFLYDIDSNLPELVEIDKNRFIQILMNLLGNSFKFTESGGIFIRATWLYSSKWIPVQEVTDISFKNALENSERTELIHILQNEDHKNQSLDNSKLFTPKTTPKYQFGFKLSNRLKLKHMMNYVEAEGKITNFSEFTERETNPVILDLEEKQKQWMMKNSKKEFNSKTGFLKVQIVDTGSFILVNLIFNFKELELVLTILTNCSLLMCRLLLLFQSKSKYHFMQ
jgi:hypothetical protein